MSKIDERSTSTSDITMASVCEYNADNLLAKSDGDSFKTNYTEPKGKDDSDQDDDKSPLEDTLT